MPNPLQLLHGSLGHPRLQIEYAEVAAPAPSAPTDVLHVVKPDWSRDYTFSASWAQIHGAALPQVGAACLLITDSRDRLRCVWWDGVYVKP